MIYSKKQIIMLSEALKGKEGAGKALLEESQELFAFESAIRGDTRAAQWLISEKKGLALFADAIFGNKSAVKVLLAKKEFELAATANYFKGDKKAGIWLEVHNLNHMVELADSIKFAQDKREIE